MLSKLFQDKNFYRAMLTLSTPIIIQNLITFSLGAVDMIMIGQLGDAPVAAVGLADQIFFLMILMMFGVSSGAAIFSAQYWGKQDIQGIHKVLSLTLATAAAGSLGFWLGAGWRSGRGIRSRGVRCFGTKGTESSLTFPQGMRPVRRSSAGGV